MTTANPGTIRVLLADDHLIVRLGIVALIDRHKDMHVVAQASSGDEAVELYRALRPDVTVMDLRMPGQGGLGAIQAIRAEDPHARILVLTAHSGDEPVYQALRAGARGYLLKDVSGGDLVEAVRAVHGGGQWIPEDIAALMTEHMQHPEPSAREIEVLRLVAKGFSNKRIAEELALSESTVRNHVASLLDKLSADDRTHAVTIALERSILDIESVRAREKTKGKGER